MKTSSALFILAAAIAVLAGLGADSPSRAQTEGQAEESEQLAYAIGVQAYIYGYPMMDLYRTLYETSLDPEREHDRTLNQFFFFRRLITHEDDWVVTPNEDTLYHRAFLDLSAEPVVLVIPQMGNRPYWFPIGNMYHNFDGNLSWDTIGSDGGAFALCGPGWQGVLPEGIERVDVSTPMMWTLGRYAVEGPHDVPAVNALQELTRLVPLSQWGKKSVRPPKIEASRYPTLTREDLKDATRYFTVLNEMLRRNPPPARDAAMLGWFREIGLHPSQQFDMSKLSPAIQRGLERAAADAHRLISGRMDSSFPIRNGWMMARLPADMGNDFVDHAAVAMLGLLYNPKQVSTYHAGFVDGQGERLDGQNDYVLHLDPPPPVDAFWSLTMYALETKRFVENPIGRYSVGDRTPGLVYDRDGSLTISIQHEEPKDEAQRANWLPAPEEPFYLILREYSPRAPVLTGDWLLNAIERR